MILPTEGFVPRMATSLMVEDLNDRVCEQCGPEAEGFYSKTEGIKPDITLPEKCLLQLSSNLVL